MFSVTSAIGCREQKGRGRSEHNFIYSWLPAHHKTEWNDVHALVHVLFHYFTCFMTICWSVTFVVIQLLLHFKNIGEPVITTINLSSPSWLDWPLWLIIFSRSRPFLWYPERVLSAWHSYFVIIKLGFKYRFGDWIFWPDQLIAIYNSSIFGQVLLSFIDPNVKELAKVFQFIVWIIMGRKHFLHPNYNRSSLYDQTRIYIETTQQKRNCPYLQADLHIPFMMPV